MSVRLESRDWAGLAILTALAAALRLAGANRDLWIDEIVSLVRYFRLPPLETLSAYASPNQHLLYSFLGSLSVHQFGEHAWSARLPALAFGIATPAATYVFVRTIGSRREASITALLLTVSYHHVWFSQNARGYAPMIFWTVLGSAMLVRAVLSRTDRAWVAYVLCMIAGTGFVLTAAFVALGNHFAVLLFSVLDEGDARQRSRLRRGASLALLAIGLGSLLLHAAVLGETLRFFAHANRTGLGSGIGGIGNFLDLLGAGFERGFGGVGVIVVAAIAILIVGWGDTLRRQPLVALMAAGGPVFGVAAILLLKYGAYPRAFLYLLPPALLFVVRGCDLIGRRLCGAFGADHAPSGTTARNRERLVAGAMIGTIIALSIASLSYNYRYPKQDYSGAIEWTRQQASSDEIIAAAGMARFAYAELYARDIVVLDSIEDLELALEQAPTVWVLYSFPRDMRLRFNDIYEALQIGGELRARFRGTVGDGTLYVSSVTSIREPPPD